jgi:hypothetical protein
MMATKIRRAFIDRPRRQVVVETSPDVFHVLPGRYDPDKVLARILEAKRVDLRKWDTYG